MKGSSSSSDSEDEKKKKKKKKEKKKKKNTAKKSKKKKKKVNNYEKVDGKLKGFALSSVSRSLLTHFYSTRIPAPAARPLIAPQKVPAKMKRKKRRR